MATFDKVTIRLDDGTMAEAVAPEILSVSRRTDIPAFYPEWFMHRLERGYCDWKNPFSQQLQHVSFEKVKFIVFWSKNPRPLLPYLKKIYDKGINFYFQHTLNNYDREGVESFLPSFEYRCATFRHIAEEWGRGRQVWRWDPIFLIDGVLTIDDIVNRIRETWSWLDTFPGKLVISFADINEYQKVKYNLYGSGIRELTVDEQKEFADKLANKFANNWLEIQTCSEKVDLRECGIKHGACIDAETIASFTHDEDFAERVKKMGKDKGQRECCLCTAAKDIGVYNTCAHGCRYCYANATPESARKNWEELRFSRLPLLI
jgi:hypothetical protein